MVQLMPFPTLEHWILMNSSKLWRGRVERVERGGGPKTVPQCRQLGKPHLHLQPQWKAQEQKAYPKASALVNVLILTHIRNLKHKQLKLQKSEEQINHNAPKDPFKPWLHWQLPSLCHQAPLLPLCSAWCQTSPSPLLSVYENIVRGLNVCLESYQRPQLLENKPCLTFESLSANFWNILA